MSIIIASRRYQTSVSHGLYNNYLRTTLLYHSVKTRIKSSASAEGRENREFFVCPKSQGTKLKMA